MKHNEIFFSSENKKMETLFKYAEQEEILPGRILFHDLNKVAEKV